MYYEMCECMRTGLTASSCSRPSAYCTYVCMCILICTYLLNTAPPKFKLLCAGPLRTQLLHYVSDVFKFPGGPHAENSWNILCPRDVARLANFLPGCMALGRIVSVYFGWFYKRTAQFVIEDVILGFLANKKVFPTNLAIRQQLEGHRTRLFNPPAFKVSS